MSSLGVEQCNALSVGRSMSGRHDQNSEAIVINRLPAKLPPTIAPEANPSVDAYKWQLLERTSGLG